MKLILLLFTLLAGLVSPVIGLFFYDATPSFSSVSGGNLPVVLPWSNHELFVRETMKNSCPQLYQYVLPINQLDTGPSRSPSDHGLSAIVVEPGGTKFSLPLYSPVDLSELELFFTFSGKCTSNQRIFSPWSAQATLDQLKQLSNQISQCNLRLVGSQVDIYLDPNTGETQVYLSDFARTEVGRGQTPKELLEALHQVSRKSVQLYIDNKAIDATTYRPPVKYTPKTLKFIQKLSDLNFGHIEADAKYKDVAKTITPQKDASSQLHITDTRCLGLCFRGRPFTCAVSE